MTDDRARKKAIRARMAATGEPYSVAARWVDQHNATSAPPAVDPALLRPYPDELDGEYPVVEEELGWPPTTCSATPEQRARAEATWRPVTTARPCRCSGPCHHGRPCQSGVEGCEGRLVHADRYPGSIFAPTSWQDDYWCGRCGDQPSSSITLPKLPWGERDGQILTVYPGVRHPNFPDTAPPRYPGGDGICHQCGGYASSGLLCDGCRREGYTDFYGELAPPDLDELDEDEEYEEYEEDLE